jgi:hypothetical protein
LNSPLTEATVYRVQAGDGRGPWRPGFSWHWVDDNRTKLQTDILAAFGKGWLAQIPQGWHSGCACRTLDGLMEWFTTLEQQRLDDFGFTPVELRVDKIIVENSDQVVFARRLPLNRDVTILQWRVTA